MQLILVETSPGSQNWKGYVTLGAYTYTNEEGSFERPSVEQIFSDMPDIDFTGNQEEAIRHLQSFIGTEIDLLPFNCFDKGGKEYKVLGLRRWRKPKPIPLRRKVTQFFRQMVSA